MSIVGRAPKRVYHKAPKTLPLMEQYPLYALNLDGINGNVNCGVGVSLDMPTNDFTVCMRINMNAVIGNHDIFGKYDAVNGGYNVCIVGNRLIMFIKSGANYRYAGSVFSVGYFYHVAFVVVVGSLPDCYINGVLSNGASGGAGQANIGSSINPFYIGVGGVYGSYSNMVAVDAQVYSRGLSQAEIQRNMRNPLNPDRNGLVLFLPMIEGQGLTVADHSGQGNNGTLIGGVTWKELMKYETQSQC